MFELDCSVITDDLWVGQYPQSPDHVLELASSGVTAILNLQSDEDFAARAINWDLFWKFYTSRRLHVVRVPIIDFDPDDLLDKLPSAVEALQQLVTSGRTVYLHCTAGLNRSPTVAIAWLAAHGGLSLAEATSLVQERRSCVPYPEVLKRWAARRT